MATKAIVKVPCWERRWVEEVEAIGNLNLTRPEWEELIKPHASIYPGRNYDMQELNRIMERAAVVRRR